MIPIVAAYTDGGVIRVNPSPFGGTWAYCHCDAAGARLHHDSGVITPEQIGGRKVTNNLTELLAAVHCLESLPDSWSGQVYTDSMITLFRIQKRPDHAKPAKTSGIPEALIRRLKEAKKRLGDYSVGLLGGHPSRVELARGRRKDGALCSRHNVFCDSLCGEESRKFLQKLTAQPE